MMARNNIKHNIHAVINDIEHNTGLRNDIEHYTALINDTEYNTALG